MSVILRALAVSNPPMYTTQEEAFAFFDSHFELTTDQNELYRRILLEGPIRGRYIGMDDREEACETDPDRLIARFLKFGRQIAGASAREAMAQTCLNAEDIGGIVVNTCTGYLCPGLSSYVSEDLGLNNAIKVLDLMGMGCGAAIPNLESAAGLLAMGSEKPILCISVEICTATLFMGRDPALTVSNCIFGDGASTAIVDRAQDGKQGGLLRIVDFESGLFPEYRDQLRYQTDKGRLRNVLGKRVPVIGAATISRVAHRLLDRRGLSQDAITWWAVHTGGTAVLERVGRKLNLDDHALRFAYEVFAEYGNMSSPSVMFVLKKILDEGRPQPGDKGMLLSFGAGFTAFAALVEF